MKHAAALLLWVIPLGCGGPGEHEVSASVRLDGGATLRPVYVRFVLPAVPDDAPVKSVILTLDSDDASAVTALVGPRPPDATVAADPDVALAGAGVTVVGVGRVAMGNVSAESSASATIDPFLRELGGFYLWDELPLYVTLLGAEAPVPPLDVSLTLSAACDGCLSPIEAQRWSQP